ncbi:MAG TPA: NAD(P)-binding domain-containing protein, partial [Alphaproteobacteria bacterium]|nr:NAD(P)-binding domain-containing protein [Alphaproteobacteria bacterium]
MATVRQFGFISLGAMGMGMAQSLVRGGHAVTAFDLRAEARESFAKAGGTAVDSPAGAAEGAALLLVAVATREQVQAVLFGEDGALAALPAGAPVAVHATVAPDDMRALASALAERGHPLIDAPMSGGAARAAAGELVLMVSGPAEALEIAEPAFDAMALTVHRLGDAAGIASTVKMVNQLLAGVHIATAAEAVALGVRAGADPQALYDIISGAAGGSWMFANRVPHMLAGDYTPLSAVEIFVKDLGIVLDQ